MDKSLVNDSYLLFKFIRDIREVREKNKKNEKENNEDLCEISNYNVEKPICINVNEEESSMNEELRNLRSDSISNYEEMMTKRNSARNSVIEDSDSFSYFNERNNNFYEDGHRELNFGQESDHFHDMNYNVASIQASTDSELVNDDVGTYNHIKENDNWNEEMKKYFHKITSIRKKVFICDFCKCKFVYKKCLMNHVEKNHL